MYSPTDRTVHTTVFLTPVVGEHFLCLSLPLSFLSLSLTLYLSVCMYVCVSIYLSIYLSILKYFDADITVNKNTLCWSLSKHNTRV